MKISVGDNISPKENICKSEMSERSYYLENERYKVHIDNGVLKEFYDKSDMINLTDINGITGRVGYTLCCENISEQDKKPFSPYADTVSVYDEYSDGLHYDTKLDICAQYVLEDDGLAIYADTKNEEISQFALNLDFNFLGKKGNNYTDQLLPSSSYMSEDKRYFYCIMPRPNGKFLLCMSLYECAGFKIHYSPYCCGHFILNYEIMSSFDRIYGDSPCKKLGIKLISTNSVEEAYLKVSQLFELPLLVNVSGGGFDKSATVKCYGKADFLELQSPSGQILRVEAEEDVTELEMCEFGVHFVTPLCGEKRGLNTTVWNGENYLSLYEKACKAIKKPYHNDDNLCEGGCFLWSLLNYIKITGSEEYDALVKEELSIIMGEREYIPRKTIVPHKTERFSAYHIHNSTRVQEQLFGASILLEAYLAYRDKKYLEFAVSTLLEIVDNFMVGGKIINGNGTDYTTVCCPVIAFTDVANILKDCNDERSEIFRQKAIDIAEYLLLRGMDFPTETEITEFTEKEMEDGSISCTALSVLYVCANIKYDKRYIEFAEKVLNLHKAWTIYTPDVRAYQSSFRWWETIWEGDGEGPAICAGHAWTIWKSEALFYLGILKGDDKALLDSWNGFLTNFSKTQENGEMYSCYEMDYIRGGGHTEVKNTLLQLKGEDTNIKYKLWHGYPQHTDNSLSRYAWIRASYSWYSTSAVLVVKDKIIAINASVENNELKINKETERVYISEGIDLKIKRE